MGSFVLTVQELSQSKNYFSCVQIKTLIESNFKFRSHNFLVNKLSPSIIQKWKSYNLCSYFLLCSTLIWKSFFAVSCIIFIGIEIIQCFDLTTPTTLLMSMKAIFPGNTIKPTSYAQYPNQDQDTQKNMSFTASAAKSLILAESLIQNPKLLPSVISPIV